MMDLTEKDKLVLKEWEESLKKRMENPEPSKKKPKYVYNRPRKYKLSEEEKAEIPRKFEQYMRIQEHAINIVKKHIKRLEDEDSDENKWMIEDLKHGLYVLEAGMKREIEDGLEGFIANLERYQKGRRPGFGLSRGFGEFLWKDEDWQNEITDAVRAIEHYYAAL